MKLYYIQYRQFQFVMFSKVRLAFFQALPKYFSREDGSAPPPPLEKIIPYAYGLSNYY